MRGRFSATFAVALLALSSAAALAQTTFSDFPVNGLISAFQVNGGYSTSNSFTLASPGTVGQVVFGAWVNKGDSVTGVTWAIGTAPFDTSLGTGAVAATSVYNSTNVDGFDVDTVTINTSTVSLPAGTYYLTLSNAISASSSPVSWDINDAGGVDAWSSAYGHVSAAGTCFSTIGISGSCASSFQLSAASATLTATLSSPVAFPNTVTGTTSAAKAATLSNTGSGTLNSIVPSITGANPGDFALSTGANACGATLATGTSCSIYVTFTPASSASFSATLSVADNATGSPQTSSLTGTGTNPAPTTWPNGYKYQATFTVAAGKVPSAQTSFPALISGTYADFATTGNGGRVANTCSQTVGNNVTSVPCDLIFTSDAAGTQLLSWEYETYTAATGAVNVWVNVPNLTNGTVVYAWYGQPSVTTAQTTPTSTWSNYSAVYHLKENPAGAAPQLNDSTINGNSATMQGAAVAGQQQPGEIDGSIGFTNSTWAKLSSTSAFSFERTDSFSLSGWIKMGSNTNGQILTKQTAAENSGWMLFQNPVGSSPAIEFGLIGTGASTLALARTPSISMGAWHYVVATYSGTSTTAGMTIYVDGVPQTLTSIANNLNTSILNNVAPAINSRATGYLESSDGMDELRVSAKGVVLTPGWVTASYNNESSPATFFTVTTGLTNP